MMRLRLGGTLELRRPRRVEALGTRLLGWGRRRSLVGMRRRRLRVGCRRRRGIVVRRGMGLGMKRGRRVRREGILVAHAFGNEQDQIKIAKSVCGGAYQFSSGSELLST